MARMKFCLCLCTLFTFSAIAAPKSVYNVRDFGAAGDGKRLDSPSINRAIDAAAKNGGGTVLLPAGTYLSGSIHLQSRIHLLDRKSTRLNSSHVSESRMPSSA